MRYLFILLVVVGCKRQKQVEDPTLLPIHRLSCTEEQMRRVENESTYCNEHSGYFSAYCYQSAMNRICTPKK